MSRTSKRVVAAALCLSLGLSACQTTRGNSETSGALLGAGAGALAGSQFGSGEGRIAAILVGALVGAIAGAAVGRELDEADRLKADLAAREAANSVDGGHVPWKSDSNVGVKGYAEPVSPATVEDGDLCKNVQSVYYIAGEETTETQKFCLKDGRWVEA
ncbi:glycine zipper 2TM domain-containing protein [Thalassobaculum salexigens]|uniref:glycine zipper 2TM domain-containing protein n=1 Tax=Thalassobaculum salexigens TaxID=455360 RepID=UPI00248E2F0D|nr:glycine zipper domain-containing protein [Thalassobaculum salexigens]